MSKLKLWKQEWDQAEAEWDEGVKRAEKGQSIRKLQTLPQMPGITPETAKNLKWKSLKWMLLQDHKGEIRKGFFTHPLRYLKQFIKSIFQKKSYTRQGDFFLYNVSSIEEFKKLSTDPRSLFVLGFSYCHKPFECPSGRFTDECIHDPENAVCRQCFIGKAVNAAQDQKIITLFIPTVHYVGGKIFEIVHAHPEKQVIFMITACEMTLEMFGDWGNMVGIKGLGVRLDGRICNTMKAFELSERGIKPGLTVVLDDTQREMLNIIKHRYLQS